MLTLLCTLPGLASASDGVSCAKEISGSDLDLTFLQATPFCAESPAAALCSKKLLLEDKVEIKAVNPVTKELDPIKQFSKAMGVCLVKAPGTIQCAIDLMAQEKIDITFRKALKTCETYTKQEIECALEEKADGSLDEYLSACRTLNANDGSNSHSDDSEDAK